MRYIYSLFVERLFRRCLDKKFFVFSCFLLVVITFFQPFDAKSFVYYIDEKGVVHFVDDESLVPEKYSNQKKVIDKHDEIPQPTTSEKKDILKKDDKEIPKDKFGNTPTYWRQKYKSLLDEKYKKERELRDLENQRDELNKKYESVRTRAFFVGDSQSLTEAATLEIKLRELENMIKMTISQLDELNKKISVDIYDEVLQAGGRTEWLMWEE